MRRKILLIEPNYKNKYPPMGLMKIATYYKRLGDDVTFFKGDLKELVLNNTYEALVKQLYANNPSIFWESYKPDICTYLKKGYKESFERIPCSSENPIIVELLKYYRKYFYNKEYFKQENRMYDRVGITTLFTFYWDITIDTINFAKRLCKKEKDVMVGGVMASILPDRVEADTGIKPYVGTLSMPGVLDNGNDMVIDTLPLDYSILEEIDYVYPANNGYLAYTTRGCVNQCKFCAVPKLEPDYKNYMPIAEQLRATDQRFGGKKDLLLLDNNVLASCHFNRIVDEIKEAGFSRDSLYTPSNFFEIAIKNLKDGYNDRGYIKALVKEYQTLIQKYGSKIQFIYDLLESKYLLEESTAKKEAILETYEVVKPYFEQMYKKKALRRYVDFNQGIDARLITDENMEKLFEIAVRPVRIAFDHWKLHDIYERAVRTAVKHGHQYLSNYVLYNFEDRPIELYRRLKLNVNLCEDLGVSIYSFPMKYHPIEEPKYFSNRDYIGVYWNRKFIRTIQAVLNSTKGKVGKGYSFFCKAFGENEEEFVKLLYMPEAMIIYRFYFEANGIVDEWWNCFQSLSLEQLADAKEIIESNNFSDFEDKVNDKDILQLLEYYRIKKKDVINKE
ncbi:hypothetical protein [Robinsoniella sp. KNHs210]|uniref:hypothetical protein n=1 Tax=Robinsoniella sp. KNHs210 TaxID=1469950 RepID=UPI000489E8D2|nr:hypothetical protein [Robinsoniella sp. KNHs210]